MTEDLNTGAHEAAPRTGPNSIQFFEVTGSFYAVADPSVSGTINDPIMQPVNALALFTPRLPVGFQAFVPDYLITAAYNAEQTVSMIGNPVQGTWQLNFNGQLTSVMPYNVSPSALQTALAALSTIGTGNVLVTSGLNPQSYNVEFTGSLGGTELLPLVPTWSDLTDANGYDCTITVATTALGSPQITADTSISVPPRQGRIMSGVLSTIDYTDTPGVMLTSDDPLLSIPAAYEPLIYDVMFSAATFNGANQVLGNFAFQAPTDGTPVDLTGATLPKQNYQRPITDIWYPQPPAALAAQGVAVINDWRGRAAARSPRVDVG
jgi:hypothetical protein